MWWKTVQQVSGNTAKPQITTHTAEDLNKGFHAVWNNIKQPDISSFIKPNNDLNTQQNIHIIDEWSKCLDGSRFLVYHQKKSVDPNKPNMIIFTSDNCLKILSKSQKWQSDGTFQVVPKPKGFYQLYIVHGYYKYY